MSFKPIRTKDNSERQMSEEELCHLGTLKKLAEPTIANLHTEEHPNLLVFPQSFNTCGDKIGDAHILEIKNDTIVTGNVMGFIGCGHTKLSISSRFTQDDKDYFLHYMLQKVFAINLFELPFNTDKESIFDFLVYLFPSFLKRAIQQGIYREYQTRQHNDANVKGRIDVARHIRQNIPFAGRVAYSTREYAMDNHLTQLIRHTIEYISRHPYVGNILHGDDDMVDAVKTICQATPTYNRNERQKIVYQNLRPINHPYYGEYRPLQQLCLQILRQEEMRYGLDDDEIYGILFDGAWLWEEYLNTILKDCGFTHPQNKLFKGRLNLFKDGTCPRYPDFYKSDFVLDAKYKGYGNTELQNIGGDDLHQIITYMFRLRAIRGGFVVPLRNGEQISRKKELEGYGGELGLYGLHVEHQVTRFKDYISRMAEQETLLKGIIETVL